MSKIKESFMEVEPEGYEPIYKSEEPSEEDKKRLRFEELQAEADSREEDLLEGWTPN